MKKLHLLIPVVFILVSTFVSAKEYHVSVAGNDANQGTTANPFKTINRAVEFAFPGDTITVHAGIYRELVNPIRGGESDSKRIVYRAAPGEKVEIKGSEIITGWENVKDGVWKVTIPESFFGGYNPYRDSIYGDWFYDLGRIHHTGELFLNGKSFYEKETIDKIYNPVANTKIDDPEGSTYTWYCESDENSTTIWANFHKINPNNELTEISTRKACFYAEKLYVNYITISGFYISQAATQWGAPTAEQVGMVAPHWCKGWIIENNVISNSKCSGITLGKERGTGHNVWSSDKGSINNDGNIHYIEVTFKVMRNNWDKEHVGSHIVRNNEIFNCEQTGICGSMGAAFSTIENNHIHDIHTKRQFKGAEIGGIKFHAAIDAVIRKNRIHNCGRGVWLDWMTQGTRVSQNLFYDNDWEDLFLEVNHGPFVVDNNIFLSPAAIRTQSEGGAFVQNLIAGTIYEWPDLRRFTPYFLPHSTKMAGLTFIKGGDDRFVNNVFVGQGKNAKPNKKGSYGLSGYNKTTFPVMLNGNVFYNGAEPSEKDDDFENSPDYNPEIKLTEKGDNLFLNFNFDKAFYNHKTEIVTTEMLGKAVIPKAAFDNRDGTKLEIDNDYFGKKRSENNCAGPFSQLKKGEVNLKVW
jgi:hypothetical protein